MKTIKQQQLNVHNDFIERFKKQSKLEVLQWLKKVMDIHQDARYTSYYQDVLTLIDDHINGKPNVDVARNLAVQIHKNAKQLQNDAQFYLRALAHMVSTIHLKAHALKCCDYIIKYLQFRTKDNDIIIGERLRQMALL